MAFLDFLAPPKPRPELSREEMLAKVYKTQRLKVFIGIYLGYAAYYLVRKNLSFAGADMMSLGYLDPSGIGDAMAGLPIAYAVSKFLMGSLSDRSDARKFMTLGLVISVLVMFVAGLISYPVGIKADEVKSATHSYLTTNFKEDIKASNKDINEVTKVDIDETEDGYLVSAHYTLNANPNDTLTAQYSFTNKNFHAIKAVVGNKQAEEVADIIKSKGVSAEEAEKLYVEKKIQDIAEKDKISIDSAKVKYAKANDKQMADIIDKLILATVAKEQKLSVADAKDYINEQMKKDSTWKVKTYHESLLPVAKATQTITSKSLGNYTITTWILIVLMCLTGWFSGMGWPPCGRVMSHWFSTNERSFKMSVWNTAHNIGSSGLGILAVIGGGSILAALGVSEAEAGWREAFIIPSIAALAIAGLCWWFIRDTPESCGLPPIDKYRNDFSGAKAKKNEEDKIPFKTLFVDYVLKNKMLWLIGVANILVYLVRNGISDWLPIYLQNVRDISKSVSKDLYVYHMIAAIPGTLIAGWLSSKFFQGRCAPVNVLCMAVTAIGAFIYWKAGVIAGMFGMEYITIVKIALAITGFAVYGPVAMISIQAIAIVPKNAAGTAAGFMGLLGYLIGDAFLSKIAFGRIVESGANGWDLTFIGFFGASVIATVICFLAMGKEKKMFEERIAAAKAELK